MSESPETDNTVQPEGTTNDDQQAQSDSAQGTDWQAEARKWEKRAKENKSAADKLAEIEESKKTEIQKATERAENAEQRITQLEHDRKRLGVIAKHSIPEDYQDLIKGDTDEELVASAEKVKSLIESANTRQAEQAPYVIPQEGGSPTSLPLNSDGIEASLRKALGI